MWTYEEPYYGLANELLPLVRRAAANPQSERGFMVELFSRRGMAEPEAQEAKFWLNASDDAAPVALELAQRVAEILGADFVGQFRVAVLYDSSHCREGISRVVHRRSITRRLRQMMGRIAPWSL